LAEAAAPAGDRGRARIEVDLGALRDNYLRLAALVAPARVLPVLKADAYGHGAIEVARRLEALGPVGFGVARVEEGVELRRAGIAARILVFAPPQAGWLETLASERLTPVVSSIEQLELVERFAAATGWRAPIQLKVDTGMHRLGVPLEAARDAFARLRSSPWLRWEGLLSHLAEADLPESPKNEAQERAFAELVEGLEPRERERLEIHLANSAAARTRPLARWNVVRPGLALFGGEPEGSEPPMRPVLALKATLIQVKPIAEGETVGYGGRWRARSATRIGIVDVGYADGYPWRAGGRADALVGGRRVPVVGAVSMDLSAVELPDGVGEPGDDVVLVGRQGEEQIGIGELARRAETIPYEILCHLRMRLPRVWLDAPRDPAASVPAGVGASS